MRKSMLFTAITIALTSGAVLADANDENESQHDHGEPGHAEHSELETVTVSALPLERSKLDSAQPVDVLAGEKLDDRRGVTLGETLSRQPGVHSTSYGQGAGRPIIRGLGGPRVRVLEDSIPAVDASAQSDDHAVSVEPMLIDRIEILRGPATLLYGSGAVGGVVNVIDNRIPDRVPTAPIEGRYELRGDSAADERTGVLRLDGGSGNWAWHIDGSWRDADDYRIPGPAELEVDDHDSDHEDDHEGGDGGGSRRLDNSFVESKSGSFGLSWIGDHGFIGASYKRFETEYGIPAPHGHGEEHEDDHGHDAVRFGAAGLLADDHEDGGDEEESVFVDLEQDRFDIKGGLERPLPGFNRARLRMSYNDYTHAEIESEGEEHAGDAALASVVLDEDDDHDHGHDHEGTVFDVESFHTRLELEHEPIGGWTGAIGFQYDDEDLGAEGAEAFIPPGNTESAALFTLQERQFGDVTLSVGARLEDTRVKIAASDDHDDEHDHDHEHGERPDRRTFTSFSASAGALWRLTDEWQASLNYSRAERAPSQTELFADGPHLATFTFEEGNPFLDTETTNGFDLGAHRHGDFFDFEVSVFYNDIEDFVFLGETDEFVDGLPVREADQADAEFYGGELAGVWQWRATGYGDFDFSLGYDWVRGRLDRGENLPRISPGRYAAGLDWHLGAARASLDYQHVSRQDDVAPGETPTASYDMLDVNLGYFFNLGGSELEAFVRGSNLLDEEARVHTSFLKNFAPKPGRNYTFGVRGRF